MFPSDVHELVVLLTERKKNAPFNRFKRAATALQILENESIGSEGKGICRLGAGRSSRKSSNSNWKKERAGHVLSIVGKDSLIPYRSDCAQNKKNYRLLAATYNASNDGTSSSL